MVITHDWGSSAHVIVSVDVIRNFFELEGKCECWSLSDFRLKLNGSAELHYDLLGYDQAQADSISVHLSTILNHSKELEQVFLIFLRNTNSRILHAYLQYFLFILHNYLDDNFYASIFGKFESVTLQAQEHLHDTLLVGSHNGPVFMTAAIFMFDVHKLHQLLDVVIMSLPLLYHHHLIHYGHDVEVWNIFSEFSSFYLGEVQEILHDVSQDAGGGLLDDEPVLQLIHQLVVLSNNVSFFVVKVIFVYFCVKCYHQFIKFFIEFLF